MPERVAQMNSRLGPQPGQLPLLHGHPPGAGPLPVRRGDRGRGGREQRPRLRPLRAGQHGAVGGPDGGRPGGRPEALAIADRLGNHRLRRHAATHYGFHLASAGQLAEAFGLLDENWLETDAVRDGVAAFSSTWTSVGQLFDLRDPEAVLTCCRRELETSRDSQAPSPKPSRPDELGRAAAIGGDLPAARQARDDAGDSRYAAPVIAPRRGPARRSGHDLGRPAGYRGAVRKPAGPGHQHGGPRDHPPAAGKEADAEGLLLDALAIVVDGGSGSPSSRRASSWRFCWPTPVAAADARPHLDRATELASGTRTGGVSRATWPWPRPSCCGPKGRKRRRRAGRRRPSRCSAGSGCRGPRPTCSSGYARARHGRGDRVGAVQRFAAAIESTTATAPGTGGSSRWWPRSWPPRGCPPRP